MRDDRQRSADILEAIENEDIVWSIVHDDTPALEKTVTTIIAAMGDSA